MSRFQRLNKIGMRGTAAGVGVLATGMLLSACGGSSATAPAGQSGGQAPKAAATSPSAVLTVNNGASGAFVDNFNPFSPNANTVTHGGIYEPLYFFDTANAAQRSPWLATSYQWSNDGKTLTFQLRHGVTWTDGTPFTSADVAYTFNLLKSSSELNQDDLPIAGATAPSSDTAVVDFTSPAYSLINFIAGTTYILPAHIWQKISDPATALNSDPVGTGSYMVKSVSGNTLTMTANPHYYFAGLPHFQTVQYLSFEGNTSSDLAIEDGSVDWGNAYIPNIKNVYLSKNPKFAISDIPSATMFLVPNLVDGPTAQLPVRQAISDAVDRSFMSDVVYTGYASATNPGALLTPNFSAWMDPSLAGKTLPHDPGAAKAVLAKAGYKLGSDGMYDTPAGAPLQVTVQVIGGYTDFVQALQILSQELRKSGIDLVVQTESSAQFTANQDSGNFQMTVDNFGYTPDPYVYYQQLLGSDVPPIGQTDTVGDYGRFKSATVDSALSAIGQASSLTTPAVKQQFYKIEQVFAQQLPLIPLVNAQSEVEFNGAKVASYPTLQQPYAASAAATAPDLGWVTARLTAAAG